jgi:hypothetical protein
MCTAFCSFILNVQYMLNAESWNVFFELDFVGRPKRRSEIDTRMALIGKRVGGALEFLSRRAQAATGRVDVVALWHATPRRFCNCCRGPDIGSEHAPRCHPEPQIKSREIDLRAGGTRFAHQRKKRSPS